jgi:transcriptional regulator with XRE-family HTH domain
MTMTISSRIAAALKEKGITQKAVAEVVNVTPSTVNTWIKTNSESIPSAYIMPICRLLGMSPEELLEGAPHQDVVEVIPDGYVLLSEEESRLVGLLRQLDWMGRNVVLNAAIIELRSKAMQGNDSVAEGETKMG